MTHATRLFAASLVIFLSSSFRPANPSHGRVPPSNWGARKEVSYETLRKQFRNPDMIYAPFVFWFWDEPLDPAKMSEMARVMASQGFNPGYAHARRSMVGTSDLPDAEWLGEKWFSSFGAALREARQRNGYLGYCDEYWWPSFQADGRILKADPSLRAQSLRWETFDLAAGTDLQVPASFFTVAVERDQPIPSAGARKIPLKMGKWIWHPAGTEKPHACWFRKTFEVPSGRVSGAVIKIIVDDAYTLYLNGNEIGRGDNWQKAGLYDVTKSTVVGTNLVAVEGRNKGDAFGLLFGMTVDMSDGRSIQIASDKSWQTSLDAATGWERPAFPSSGWPEAHEIADTGGGSWRYNVDHIDHVPATIRSQTLQLIGAGAPFEWKAPAGNSWRVYAFSIYNHDGADGGKVNYIDSRLAPLFIQTALEPYAVAFPDQLGRSIPGDFIDNEGDYGWGLAWSSTLDERYRQRYGRDIRLWMPLMIDRDAEGKYAKARWDWFDTVSDIYADGFRAVTDWHERRGMYTTAHFWEEGIQPQVNAVGDHMKVLRALTMPGQDCLGRKPLRVHDFKEVESVAEFQNVRAATELMGAGAFEGTPWGTFNPPFLKQAVNAVTAWGMSHIIPHGIFTTRKLTRNPWPPDWYSENPMFPYLHLWNDFARRASYIASMGHAVPDVLLYNPMESAWIQADADILDVEMWSFSENNQGGRRVNEIDRVYANAIDDLTAARIEFLIGDRYYVKQMSVKEGKLVRDPFAFRTLVLPSIDILELDTARKILDFAKAGGQVYALGNLPSGSAEQGMGDPRMKELVEGLRSQKTFSATLGGIKQLLERNTVGLESPVRFVSGGFPMLQHRRSINGKDFFWLVNNNDREQSCEVAVLGVRGAASIWDCETGGIRPVASTETKDGSRLSLVFKPFEAFWLVFDPKMPARRGRPERSLETNLVVAVEGTWMVTCDPKIQPAMEFPVVPPPLFAQGVETQLEDWKSWGLGRFSGLMDYQKRITVESAAGPLLLDLGKVAHAAEVWVNGTECGARLWGPHVFDITRAVRPGANEIRVRVANLINNSYDDPQESGLLGPVRLVRLVE